MLENSITDAVPLIPTSPVKIIMDICFMLLLLFMVLFIPVQIGFNIKDEDYSGYFKVFSSYIVIGWFLIDIFILKSNTAVYNDGKMICNRYSVIGLYLKGNFLLDIITTFSLILAYNLNEPIINIIFLIRFKDIIKLYHDIEVTF